MVYVVGLFMFSLDLVFVHVRKILYVFIFHKLFVCPKYEDQFEGQHSKDLNKFN
jgi:hypothetical protein